jgi:hypothetical protein
VAKIIFQICEKQELNRVCIRRTLDTYSYFCLFVRWKNGIILALRLLVYYIEITCLLPLATLCLGAQQFSGKLIYLKLRTLRIFSPKKLVLYDLYFARESASNFFEQHHAFRQNLQFFTSAIIGKFCIEKHIIYEPVSSGKSFVRFST